jgi:hypothetical protein
LIEFADFDVKLQKKPTKWDTANGIMQTDGSVIIEKFSLPQFSRKQIITTSFHMYQKTAKDKYDFIIGRDLLLQTLVLIFITAPPNLYGTMLL